MNRGRSSYLHEGEIITPGKCPTLVHETMETQNIADEALKFDLLLVAVRWFWAGLPSQDHDEIMATALLGLDRVLPARP